MIENIKIFESAMKSNLTIYPYKFGLVLYFILILFQFHQLVSKSFLFYLKNESAKVEFQESITKVAIQLAFQQKINNSYSLFEDLKFLFVSSAHYIDSIRLNLFFEVEFQF
jgi:hypothetical protein